MVHHQRVREFVQEHKVDEFLRQYHHKTRYTYLPASVATAPFGSGGSYSYPLKMQTICSRQLLHSLRNIIGGFSAQVEDVGRGDLDVAAVGAARSVAEPRHRLTYPIHVAEDVISRLHLGCTGRAGEGDGAIFVHYQLHTPRRPVFLDADCQALVGQYVSFERCAHCVL